MSGRKSLSDEATSAGRATPARSDVSLGEERTIGAGDAGGIDTVMDDIEVVDLESRYKIEGTLGQGGMGAVLLATDKRLDRKVAIKRILAEAASSKTAVSRFLTEAKAIAAISHPNVVQIHDYGQAKDGPFLIMEYVDGGNLADRCRESALPLEEAIDIACHLCDGLAKAHDLGIIHRDIKPTNVLLTKDGTPKLTDFGLARAESADHGQTMTGAVLGTPDFMPPEQRRNASEVDHRSDLWSLAATVYQMVTGRSPKVIRLHELPRGLQPVIAKALEDRQDRRYQSAREFRDTLKSSLSGGETGQGKAVGAVAVDVVLQEGQCKACATVTADLTKKFCRNPQCGASLRVACLQCEASIPVWDGVCGECGGNQPSLVETRRATLNAQLAEAERLAAGLQFDAAVKCAEGITVDSRPEFADIAAWVPAFVAATTKEFSRQRTVVEQLLKDAQRHVEACDYPAAIHAIEAIPEPLRDARSDGVLSECRALYQESEGLIAEIAGRVGRRETAGLLPLVERASELRKDRLDLAKMCGQLRERRDGAFTRANAALDVGDTRQAAAEITGFTAEDLGQGGAELIARVGRAQLVDRQQKLTCARNSALVMAREKLAHHDYDGALDALGVVAAAVTTPEVQAVRDQASKCSQRARALVAEINKRVAADQLDDLLNVVNEYLALQPESVEITSLRKSLVERDAGIAAKVECARQLTVSCRFDEAAEVLRAVTKLHRSASLDAELSKVTVLAGLRGSAMRALTEATAGDYSKALVENAKYCNALLLASIADAECEALSAKWENKRKQELRKRQLLSSWVNVMVLALTVLGAIFVLVWGSGP